jgi:K+-dependent Na+/Ca+ exchanger-like protein
MESRTRTRFAKFGKGQRYKMQYRAIGFLVIVGTYSVIHAISSKNSIPFQSARRLQSLDYIAAIVGDNETDFDVKTVALVAIGVLYMFVAIAIVCDEFFVPALEEIASDNYLNLSMDVAGATLMAAGGSAPELFTSLIGTFQRSEIGFGTIVGSAVFNVLFVIGMCAIFSNDVLELTWWPLFRDCTYYALTLGVLALFCGVSSPNEIEVWEALVLFALYIGYVVFMKFNENVHFAITKRVNMNKVGGEVTPVKDSKVGNGKTNIFRAGLLNLFTGKGSVVEKVGVTMVSKISGDVNAVFKTLDVSGDGFIDCEEFKQLIEMLGATILEEDVDQALGELDENNDGKVRHILNRE